MEHAGKGEAAGRPAIPAFSADAPEGRACGSNRGRILQARAARARMLGRMPFCALRGAQRKTVRRADWAGCAEGEADGTESYCDVLRACRTPKPDNADGPGLAPLLCGWGVTLIPSSPNHHREGWCLFFCCSCVLALFLRLDRDGAEAVAWRGPQDRGRGAGGGGEKSEAFLHVIPPLFGPPPPQPPPAKTQARNG